MQIEKAIKKGITLKSRQVEEIEKIIDITKHGAFSQFIQDAVDMKLAQTTTKNKPNRKAS